MPKHVCIVTGPIVGLRSYYFIKDTIEFAANVGEKVVDFHLFNEILEQEGIEYRNEYEKAVRIGEILDGYQYRFKDMREKAYCSIARKIDQLDEKTSAVIRMPAAVDWRGIMIEFKDHYVIAKNFKPGRVVTLIDAEWKIKNRLEKKYGKHVLRVIAHQDSLGIEGILRWLGAEVSVSEDWAEWCSHITGKRVEHIVLGVETPSPTDRDKYVRDVDNLAKLITQPDLPTFYASYSMTVDDPKVRQSVHDSICRLRHYGAVIDPASIELGDEVDPAVQDVQFAYTVCRDLRWDVQKVDIVAAFHPYDKIPPLSTGMMDELGHARAFRKERYLVLPKGAGSPFTRDNFVPSNHVFKKDTEFFDFIEKKRRPVLKPRFAKFMEEFCKAKPKKGGRGKN